ncbi:hypothetical protein HPB52_021389 [Rhipicephalus sanguineus]|uniref:Uncharacterized protein n=1 Tax=Rhipicephalus sanguineus TaxID=34632 RepID=A0A9D4SSV9_RHISA|nr:hypothetical protein HPB52_021389 [Rhipicephalus sanguineus]
MLFGRMHDDEDNLLHDILELERIKRERREIFGSRTRSLASLPGSERSLPMTRELNSDENQGTDRHLGLRPVSPHGRDVLLLDKIDEKITLPMCYTSGSEAFVQKGQPLEQARKVRPRDQ